MLLSPGAKVDVSFVHGRERFMRWQKFIDRAGLSERLAVVQDSYVPGCADMVFEEGLWRTLLDFIVGYDPAGLATIARKPTDIGKSEAPVDDYLGEWAGLVEDDRRPPPFVLLRKDGQLILSMVTEYWVSVGGPMPYHDSYTYSIFSKRDLSGEVPAFLRQAPASFRWQVSAEPIDAAQVRRAPSPEGDLLRWLASKLGWKSDQGA